MAIPIHFIKRERAPHLFVLTLIILGTTLAIACTIAIKPDTMVCHPLIFYKYKLAVGDDENDYLRTWLWHVLAGNYPSFHTKMIQQIAGNWDFIPWERWRFRCESSRFGITTSLYPHDTIMV